MKRKIIIGVFVFLFVTAIGIGLTNIEKNKLGNINQETNKISGIVLEKSNEKIAIQDNKNIIYTFSLNATNFEVGDNVIIEYTGLMDNNNCMECEVISYTSLDTSTDSNGIPVNWLDNGIFSSYYNLAYNKLKTMTLEEKIGQIFLVRYPDTNQTAVIDKYKVAGFVFYEKDFKDKTKNEVINMIKNLQDASNIPILTAVDEEGGRVIRISSNANLVSEPFKSPSQLYQEGGLELIKEDTINKSKILNELGINLNLAPVVDVSENPIDYMYDRTIQQNTEITSNYAKTVISASKGTGVSYTLKHFPGYGNNTDTHTSSAIDARSYDDILNNDIPPFKAGIDAKAEAILISHNTVTSIDNDNPASLSKNIHNLLRNELDFTGVIITDDLEMGAVKDIENKTVKAILAGNDLIIVTNYEESINEVKNAIENNTLSEDQINKLAFRVLSFKYYKGMMISNQK